MTPGNKDVLSRSLTYYCELSEPFDWLGIPAFIKRLLRRTTHD